MCGRSYNKISLPNQQCPLSVKCISTSLLFCFINDANSRKLSLLWFHIPLRGCLGILIIHLLLIIRSITNNSLYRFKVFNALIKIEFASTNRVCKNIYLLFIYFIVCNCCWDLVLLGLSDRIISMAYNLLFSKFVIFLH